MYRWSLLKTGYCVRLKFVSIFLSLVFEKHCKRWRSLLKWSGAGLFDCDLRQTFPSPTTILFFSKIRLQFFISLILNLTRVKSWKDEINTQVLSFFLIFLETKRFKAAKWALAFEILVHTVSYGLQIDQSQDKIRLSHIINKVIWNFLNTQKMLVFP